MPPPGTPDRSVLAVAREAAQLVTDGAKVGLGTGRAAAAFVDELGARGREGLRITAAAAADGRLVAERGARARRGPRITAAATSEETARQAVALGIRMIELTEGVIL